MALSTTASRVQYLGDNSTTVFTVPFEFFSDTDLQVFSTVIATGVSTTLILNTDYTLTGAGVGNGGTLTMMTAPSSAVRITIVRVVNLVQASVYNEDADFPVKVVEGDFDYSMMTLQQQQDLLNRSFQIPITDPTGTIINIPNSVERANKVLSFDGAGNVSATVDGGYYRGNYVPGTKYFFRDLFADQMTGDIYFTLITYVASSISDDLTAGNISLLFSPGNYAVGNPFNIAQFSVTTGSANSYIISDLTNYTYNTAGAALTFQANFTNTGAATLNVNALGDIPIVGIAQGALTGGEIRSTGVYYIVYDGTSFNLLNPSTGYGEQFSGVTTGSVTPTPPNILGSTQIYAATAPGFQYVDGRTLTFVANFTNYDATLALTQGVSLPVLNINSLGNIPILDEAGIPIYAGGVILSGVPYTATYVGGNFYLKGVKNKPVYLEFRSFSSGGSFTAGAHLLFGDQAWFDYGMIVSYTGSGSTLWNNGVFTAPYTGVYQVTCSFGTMNSTSLVSLIKNGSSVFYGGSSVSSTTFFSAPIKLTGGDTLSVSLHTSTTALPGGTPPFPGFLTIAEIR